MNSLSERAINAAERVGLADIENTFDIYMERGADEDWTHLEFATKLLEEQSRRVKIRSKYFVVTSGIETANRRYRTKFITCLALVAKLKEAKESNSDSEIFRSYSRPSPLTIDETGFTSLDENEVSLFFWCRMFSLRIWG